MFGRTEGRKDGKTGGRKERKTNWSDGLTEGSRFSRLSVLPSFRLTALAFAPHVPSPHPQAAAARVRVLGPGLPGGIRDHAPLRERLPGVPGGHRAAALGLAAGRPR